MSNYSELNMGNLSRAQKITRVYTVADKIATYTAKAFGEISHFGGSPKLWVGPIDWGGMAKGWNFLEEPLRNFLNTYEIEVVAPEEPLPQSPSCDRYKEFRPIKGSGARKYKDKKVGALLMLDSSAATVDGTTGASMMGGVIWACRNLQYFGDGCKDVIIMSAVMRDYCDPGISNFSCYFTSDDWIGPKGQLRKLKHIYEELGAEEEDSPINAIQDFHFCYPAKEKPQSDSNLILPIIEIPPEEIGLGFLKRRPDLV